MKEFCLMDEFEGRELIIRSVVEAEKLHSFFCNVVRMKWKLQDEYSPFYRGEQQYNWDLKSGIFRPQLFIKDSELGKKLERNAVDEFERVIKEELGNGKLREIYNGIGFGREWDLLFQAQHAGIRTSIIDWTGFIHIALFFATEESEKFDNIPGQLWCFMMPHNIYRNVDCSFGMDNVFHHLDPFNLEKPLMVDPSTFYHGFKNRIFEYRWFKQNGRFFITPKELSNKALNKIPEFEHLIIRFKIPADSKKLIRKELGQTYPSIKRKILYVKENSKCKDLIETINNKIYGNYFKKNYKNE